MVFSKEKISELEARVKKAPGSPAFARLADYHRSQGHVDNAITLCEKGVKENPDYPTGHLLLGRCYFEKERVDEAIAEFEAVLKLDRKNIFALKIMGDICAQKGQNAQAAQFYKKAANADPLNTAVQDMFRRFERYYREPGSVKSVNTPLSAEPVILDEISPSAASADLHDMLAAEPAPAVSAPAEDISRAVSFDDLDGAAAPAAPSPIAAPASSPAPAPSAPAEPAVPEAGDTMSLEESLGLDIPDIPEAALEITEEEAVRIGEEAQEEAPTPDVEEAPPVSPEPPEPAAPVKPASPVVPVSTEMVDLPPEMTGGPREERVGDFKARKSIVDRLIEEQTGLLETVSSAPPKVKAVKRAPVPEEEAFALAEENEPASDPDEKTSPSSEPASNPDGFYTVTGGNSTATGATDALAGIDEVEMAGTIDESALDATAVEEQSQETLDEFLEPGTGQPLSGDPEVRESAVASARIEEEPPKEQEGEEDALHALLGEIDADDSLKGFVAAADIEKAKPRTPPPPPDPVFSHQAPEILEETKTEPKPEEELSPAASGLDGYYNLAGDTASVGGEEALAGIDHVEMGEALDEDALSAPPEEPGPAPVAEPVAVPPAPAPPAPASDVEELIPPPSEPEEEKEETDKKKPRKKSDKGKTKTLTKVVSNVATTSLAEIYLRQGHKEQALAVYKKILEQSPENKRLQTKIEKLEKEIEEAEASN